MMMLTNPAPQGEQLWNWHDNVLEGISRLNGKRNIAQDYFRAVQRNLGYGYVYPPDYEEFDNLSALEIATIQLYRNITVTKSLEDELGHMKDYYSCYDFGFNEIGEMYWLPRVHDPDEDYVQLVVNQTE